VTQAAQGFAFDLADPFASKAKLLANFFQSVIVAVFKAEPQA
jgi:hypothetical protein